MTEKELLTEIAMLKSISWTIIVTMVLLILFIVFSSEFVMKSPFILGLCVAILFGCAVLRAVFTRISVSAKSELQIRQKKGSSGNSV